MVFLLLGGIVGEAGGVASVSVADAGSERDMIRVGGETRVRRTA